MQDASKVVWSTKDVNRRSSSIVNKNRGKAEGNKIANSMIVKFKGRANSQDQVRMICTTIQKRRERKEKRPGLIVSLGGNKILLLLLREELLRFLLGGWD